MSNISVKIINGHWTVNSKKLNECNFFEKKYFENYLNIFKSNNKK